MNEVSSKSWRTYTENLSAAYEYIIARKMDQMNLSCPEKEVNYDRYKITETFPKKKINKKFLLVILFSIVLLVYFSNE